MKKKRVTGGVGMLALVVVTSAAALGSPGVIWQEGFEAGFPPNVQASGNWSVIASSAAAQSGSRGADVIGPNAAGGDSLLFQVSSAGHADLEFRFGTKIREALEAADTFTVSWSSDAGATWQSLMSITNEPVRDWLTQTFPLPAPADNNPNLAFRFNAAMLNASDRVGLDDLVLVGTIVPEPSSVSLVMAAAGMAVVVRRRPYHRRLG